MTVYDQVLQIIKRHRVHRIFGIPGDAINPLVDAIRRDQEMTFIHVTHEESGAFAASATAKLTGDLAVCAGTVGPGAIHLLNGLYDAKKDQAPVLALVGQIPTDYLGSDYHQEVDLPALFRDLACFLGEVRTPAQLPQLAIEAANAALTEGGVAVLVIPHNLGSVPARDLPINAFRPADRGRLAPPPSALAALAEKLRSARRVSLLIGEGARGAGEQIIPLAEHLQAPIICSLKAKDIVPEDHPLFAGGLGLLGSRGGVAAMEECDLLLQLGSDFPYREWIKRGSDIVQVDTRPRTLGRRQPGVLGIHADAASVIAWILENTEPRRDTAHRDSVARSRTRWDKLMARQEAADRSEELVHPQVLTRALGDLAPDHAIFTCDTGEVTVWGARHLHLRAGQRFSLSFNLASMAYALPAALGAQLAFPDRTVISLSGDGGFNMLMGDFLTAVKYALPIKVIVYNNGKLGLIKMEQEAEGLPECETRLQNPDYAALAEAMGGTGFKIRRPQEISAVLHRALATEGPVIVDAAVNPDEITWPPKIEPAQAIGFGLAKLKELLVS